MEIGYYEYRKLTKSQLRFHMAQEIVAKSMDETGTVHITDRDMECLAIILNVKKEKTNESI